MSPLNDDELSSLIEQAKRKTPEPRPDLAVHALRTYQTNVVRSPKWRRLLVQPVPIPLPLGILAAVFLVLIGIVGGRSFRGPSVVVQTRNVEIPVVREHLIYGNCPAVPQGSNLPVASLLKEFQPVSQIRPRVVRSIRDDQ